MLKRGRIGEGWLGELYAGEDVQGRPVRFSSLQEWTEPQRQWLLERMRLMNLNSVQGACPHLGVQVIQGEACWVGAWRDAVQLSVVLDNKHIPNTVIMAVAFGMLQSLQSAAQKGLAHGALHPNAIWLGLDGEIWIDGYGYTLSSAADNTKDVYEVGRLLIEMFLGNCPFPVSQEEHSQALIDVGLELKAMGLPSKLPRQIVRLVHLDPEKRPSLDILVQKWKLTRGKQIISSWVRSQFPQLVSAHRPEDRIPTAQRIAPLPFPKELYKAAHLDEQPLEDPIDSFPDERIDPLVDDDTAIRSQGHITSEYGEDDHTHELLSLDDSTDIASEEMMQDVEETQAIQFLESFEKDFFDSEPTSRLVVDTPLIESEVVAVDEVDLSLEMEVPSRRPLMGLLWIGGVGLLTIVGLYWTIPDVPAYPEDESIQDGEADSLSMESDKPIAIVAISPDIETTSDTENTEINHPTVASTVEIDQRDGSSVGVVQQAQGVENLVGRKAIVGSKPKASPPKPKNISKSSQKSTSSNGKEVSKYSNSTNATSTNSAEGLGARVKDANDSKDSKDTKDNKDIKVPITETDAKTSVDSQDSTSSMEEKSPKKLEVKPKAKANEGLVVLKGDAQSLRLEHKGRDVKVGSVSAGKYDVYVTFEGFSEFKVTTLNVEAGGTYTLQCNSMFATCQVR